jgi:L-rhamnose mutarotase
VIHGKCRYAFQICCFHERCILKGKGLRYQLFYDGRLPGMPKGEYVARYAFKLRLKAGAIEEYERAHANIWPELRAKIKEVGISKYSIFRRAQELILCMEVEDFDRAWDELAKDPFNQRWQNEMGRLFEPVPDQQPGERFAIMKEVFYLE